GVGRAVSLGDVRGTRRFAQLGAPALREAFEGKPPKAPVPLFLALPDAASCPDLDSDAVLDELASLSEVPLGERRIVRETHAAFAMALAQAMDLLLERGGEAVVGAIDSRYGDRALQALAAVGHLHTQETPLLRIPSEAAAFVRLAYRAPTSEGDRNR